uniref:HTH domain-containing protein n=1 Tax=Roseivirga sp. TaxID=1964215 RepID=UPI0040485234
MLKQIERIQRIHELIKKRATGTPKELALKLNLSERQIYNLLELMKALGAPITYSSKLYTYCKLPFGLIQLKLEFLSFQAAYSAGV